MSDMGDMGDMWRAFNEASKEHRTEKQEWAKEALQDWCKTNGVTMSELQPWHVRLTKAGHILDIFPQRQKWHNVTKNERGQYKSLIGFVASHFANF